MEAVIRLFTSILSNFDFPAYGWRSLTLVCSKYCVLKGVVIKSTGSWYKVLDEEGKEWNCRIRGKFKIEGIRSTNPLAVGDYVSFQPEADQQTAIIIEIHDRKNYIIRKSTNLSRKSQVIAANLDQAMLIATLHQPRTSTGFIDRFLVTCEAYTIPAFIVFNKSDLYDEEETSILQDLIDTYEDIGYRCLKVSALTGTGLNELKDLLKDQKTLLSGHSGVGKSTLVNAIEPGLDLKTAQISDFHLKGKHTTTFAEMFRLSQGGFIIDTPGIKEFGLIDFEAWDLCHYFPEMRELFNLCKFDNCTHYHEPGCAVKEKVEAGEISESRYFNYLNILSGEDNRA
jgi:ribosome biogenesis GTPase / thiamine phosphate phosphatase